MRKQTVHRNTTNGRFTPRKESTDHTEHIRMQTVEIFRKGGWRRR